MADRTTATIDPNIPRLDKPDFCYPPVFEFHEISEMDICNAISRLGPSQVSADDGITGYMLKCVKTEICPILKYIFNLSIQKRVFPSQWKMAIVTPLFKSGQTDDPNNYRPISVLSTLGKILERCAHSQCYDYLSSHNILHPSQSGFRKGYSTDTCVIDLLDNIYREVDDGGACGVLFIDLSKAFDTVDHQILVEKLRHLGFRPSACAWFMSYLDHRYQRTKVGDALSGPMRMNSGVPQGSILGPLLFICYINDLPCSANHSMTFLYADDTALLVKGKELEDIRCKMEADLKNVNTWFGSNRLAMNQSKTKSMLFCSSRSMYRDSQLNLKQPIGNGTVVQTEEYKYLGIWLDPQLNFKTHVNKTCAKVKSRTGLLWRMRNVISQSLAMDLYQSLIEPHFTYGDMIYDGCGVASKHKLQVQQNQALRAVLNVDQFYPSVALHDKLKCEWLDVQRSRHCSNMAYKGLNDLTPVNISNMFVKPEHKRTLRSAATPSFITPMNKTVFGDGNFINRCHRYWGQIPTDVKQSPSIASFKCNLMKASCFMHNPRY